MDSRVVARKIKNEIWPLLHGKGSGNSTRKTAWRDTPDQIHVINYQSFNSYLAERVGCMHSHSLPQRGACSFDTIPFRYFDQEGTRSFRSKPQEYHCHFRHRLLKGNRAADTSGDATRQYAWNRMVAIYYQCFLDDSRLAIERDGTFIGSTHFRVVWSPS